MTRESDNEREFYVIHFIELPFEGIDDYVCVPYTWLRFDEVTYNKVAVAYPKDENPSDTKDRVKRKERRNDKWRFYMATVKYKSDFFNYAEFWITTRNNYKHFVEEESKVTDKQPKLPVNKKLRSVYQNHVPKFNDNFRKPLPTSIKRPANTETKKEIDGKRLKQDKPAPSSSAVVNDAKVEARSPKIKQSVIIQDIQSIDSQQRPKPRIRMSIKLKDRKQLVNQSTQTNSKPKRGHSMDDAARSSVTDHEEISDREMSAAESPVETTDSVYGTANGPRHDSADRPTADQNSTSKKVISTSTKFILLQQMLDKFAILFLNMISTLRDTTDMYNTLRSSIHDTTAIYKKLLGSVEQFNTAGYTASSASPSSNLIHEGPRSPEATHSNVTASASSSNQDQHRKDVANKKPKNNKLYRFVLPPEYDAYDTRWTLKHRTNMPGLVELMPQSGVYVSPENLNYCQQVSKDCKSLALRLLTEVFNRNALSICSSMSEKEQASTLRPDLDDHACSVLLNLVLEHGLQRGWNTDLEPILRTLHTKMLEIRFKYGVMVEC